MSKFFLAADPALHLELARLIGADRLHGYLSDCGGDLENALRLYVWNASLTAAFLPCIGSVEIALRNALDERLGLTFGAAWYDDSRFVAIGAAPCSAAIGRAKSHILSSGKAVTRSRIVGQLTFGFWVMLLRSSYARTLWPVLRPAFARYTRRSKVTDAFDPLVAFRNRVAHHRAIYDRQPTLMYERIRIGANLLSPKLEGWIEHHGRVSQLLAQGPVTAPTLF